MFFLFGSPTQHFKGILANLHSGMNTVTPLFLAVLVYIVPKGLFVGTPLFECCKNIFRMNNDIKIKC